MLKKNKINIFFFSIFIFFMVIFIYIYRNIRNRKKKKEINYDIIQSYKKTQKKNILMIIS